MRNYQVNFNYRARFLFPLTLTSTAFSLQSPCRDRARNVNQPFFRVRKEQSTLKTRSTAIHDSRMIFSACSARPTSICASIKSLGCFGRNSQLPIFNDAFSMAQAVPEPAFDLVVVGKCAFCISILPSLDVDVFNRIWRRAK